MIYKIEFSKDAKKSIAKYKKSNPVLYKKLANLLDELMEHPRTGTGHPEPLKAGNSISYSRRITAHDRLIYDIHDETVTVLIIEVEGHYKGQIKKENASKNRNRLAYVLQKTSIIKSFSRFSRSIAELCDERFVILSK